MEELFGSSPAPAQKAPAPSQAAKIDNVLAAFASTSTPAGAAAAAADDDVHHAQTLPLAAVTPSAFLTSEVLPYTDKDGSAALVGAHKAFGLYCVRVERPDCCGYAFVVNNTHAHDDTAKVAITVAALPDFTVAMHAAAGVASAEGLDKLTLARLPPRATCVGVAKLTRAQASLPRAAAAFAGSFAVGGAPAVRLALPPLGVGDYLRPTAHTTQQIGGVWAKHSCEKKVQLRADAIGSATRLLERALHAHTASTIGNEAILCCRLALPPPQELLVLFHCRVDKGVATVAVRSQSAATTDAVVSAIPH